MENDYETLNKLLSESAANLDKAAHMIRDLDLSPEANIKKIGEALANIFELQLQIYRLRPDLKPNFLKK